MSADFTPSLNTYTDLTPFRFWCQKILPIAYDDSLSYYELLCKVVDYLNKTMEDVELSIEDVEKLHDAYEDLQEYVNDYFTNLDVQEEINNKLDALVADGTIHSIFSDDVMAILTQAQAATQQAINNIPTVVSTWLGQHVTQETGYVIDNSLSTANAAADALATGVADSNIKSAIDLAFFGEIEDDDFVQGYRTQADYYTVHNQTTRCTSARYYHVYKGDTVTISDIADGTKSAILGTYNNYDSGWKTSDFTYTSIAEQIVFVECAKSDDTADVLVSDITTVITLNDKSTRVTGAENDIGELKSDLNELNAPLKLVATYENKILRKTGMEDYNGWNVYQFEVPDNAEKVHIKSNFYGNVFIIFTDMSSDGNFSANPYQRYPSSGYSQPTTFDDDCNTLKFKYVWIPLYVGSGVATEAKTSYRDIVDFTVDNSIVAYGTSGGLSDFNDAKPNQIYVITSGQSSITNYPPVPNGGTLLCYTANVIDTVQLFISNQNAVYFRRLWGTTWGAWKQIQTEDTIQTVVQSIADNTVATALSEYYPYNILSAFKNITCIGDSLTYSQVYTSANTSRQAYKPYPKIIAEKAGATETILATAGDTAAQAWARNGDNIVQKEAQLTLIYLGTNGGLTDTMDTDMVGDDYTQWADTNTGCYGKLIAKSIEVGSRVVLIKVHTNAQATNPIVEKMALRFNIPYVENTYLSGVKYHGYPDGSGTNGTHYNDFGYAVFADQIAHSISQLSAADAVKIIPT